MTAIQNVVRFGLNLVGLVSAIIVALFILLAYTSPMELDALVHQSHELIPQMIDGLINLIHPTK